VDTSANAITPQVFATCVTRAANSEAAWKVYAHGQGLNSHCLQMELDAAELRSQISSQYFNFAEMPIEYKDENYITNLHKKRSSNYQFYFRPFSFYKYLQLICLKRDAYTYEKETRYIIIPNMNVMKRNTTKKAGYLDLNIDWKNVIRSVRIDKNCSMAELKSIQQACYSVGIDPDFNISIPTNGFRCPPNSVKIQFKLFDIDDMPGRSRITIK